MILCKDAMTQNPILCYPSTSIFLLALIMHAENIGMIPVVRNDGNHQVVGVITDRDIVMRVVAESLDIHYGTAEEIMTKKPVCVYSNDPVNIAISKMAEFRISRLIILNEKKLIVGIISSSDLASFDSLRYSTGKLLASISQRTITNSVAKIQLRNLTPFNSH